MQCLDYALDKIHSEGGYLVAGRSVHWPIAHAMHSALTPDGVTHYMPPDDLKTPWYAVFGYAGGEIVGDETARRPMSRRGIVLSAALLLALSLSWAARSWIKEIRQ